jgi:hypothetical protein
MRREPARSADASRTDIIGARRDAGRSRAPSSMPCQVPNPNRRLKAEPATAEGGAASELRRSTELIGFLAGANLPEY